MRDVTSSLSSLLLHSSNLIVEVGRDVVRFLTTLLAVVYALRIAVIAFRYVPVRGSTNGDLDGGRLRNHNRIAY
jgi:hypothetical protein